MFPPPTPPAIANAFATSTTAWEPRLSEGTWYDPNSLLVDARQVHNGISITLTGSAAARDTVPTTATLAIPYIVDVNKIRHSSFNVSNCLMRFRLFERVAPTVTPSLLKLGLVVANGIPSAATSALGVGYGYPSTTLRRVYNTRCIAGTWTNVNGTTGQSTHFGVDGSYLPYAANATDELNALPLDSTGNNIATIFTNTARYASQMTSLPDMTHVLLTVGWEATGGSTVTVVVQPRVYYLDISES